MKDILHETFALPNLVSVSTNSPSESEQPQLAAIRPMSHQEYHENLRSILPDSTRNESDVEAIVFKNNVSFSKGSELAQVNGTKRVYGWTPKDNQLLYIVIRDVLRYKDHPLSLEFGINDCDDKVTWRLITELFNRRFNQNRTRGQIYSHFRYNLKDVTAEERVLLALDEVGVPVEMLALFSKNIRCVGLLKTKLDKMKLDGKDVALPDSKEAAFRKRVKDIVVKGKGLQVVEKFKQLEAQEAGMGLKALKEGRLHFPSKIMTSMRFLAKTNSQLKNKYRAKKTTGRPTKKTKTMLSL